MYESQALENAHSNAAAEGDSYVPSPDERIDLHFVCFVKAKDGHLWELDGRRKGPIDRGQLPEGEDVLHEAALKLGPRRFIRREQEAGNNDLRFSLIVLATSFD